MSNLIDDIVSTIPAQRRALGITLAGAYAQFTAIRAHRLGLSMTLIDDRIFPDGESGEPRGLGSIHTMSAGDLLPWHSSKIPLERSYALAAINASIPWGNTYFCEGNALDLTEQLGRGKNVAIVGHFPHMEPIRQAAARCSILELRPQPGDHHASEAPAIIPEADVTTVTGVTCLNDTLVGLLALKKPGSIFIVLGPTVPLSPVLFDYGVDIIAGSWVEDEKLALPRLQQGATPRQLHGKMNVFMPRDRSLLEGYPEVIPRPELR